ncbi:MAG: alpha/beta hydrolase fold domain-containing protein [Eggerthella lenta]
MRTAAIMGDSGGAALRRGPLSSRAHVPLAKQILTYPMLDDRTVAATMSSMASNVWFAENNKMAWRPCWASAGEPMKCCPARPRCATSFEGLAPAFLEVGELDLFRDETIEYAKRLMALMLLPSPCAHGPHAHLRHVPAAHCRQGLRVRSYVISQL